MMFTLLEKNKSLELKLTDKVLMIAFCLLKLPLEHFYVLMLFPPL